MEMLTSKDKITVDCLRRMGACHHGIVLFSENFPDGATESEIIAEMQRQKRFDYLGWLRDNLKLPFDKSFFFKVGDIVTIRSDLQLGEAYTSTENLGHYAVLVDEGILNAAGKQYVIKEVFDSCGCFLVHGLDFSLHSGLVIEYHGNIEEAQDE